MKLTMRIQLIVLVFFCVWHSHAARLMKLYPPQSTRIVGGNDAEEGEAPYQCSMQVRNFHFCGCSIINSKWLVTASHCIDGQRPSDLEILVGTNDLTKGGTRYKVSALYQHSRFNIPYFANDIGLIRISGSISFTTSIQPIEYSPEEVQPNSTLQLTGWGYLSADGIAPNALQIINLSAISYEQCQAIYGGDVEVDIGHICTLTKMGEGACNGDSGGPLTFEGKLVGVVNWGVPCAQGMPDAFARVSYYHDWIRTTINSNP